MNRDDNKHYVWRLFLAFDQLANVLFSPLLNAFTKNKGFGYPDETLSSVFGKNTQNCKLCMFMCRCLHFLDPQHCEKAIELDEGR